MRALIAAKITRLLETPRGRTLLRALAGSAAATVVTAAAIVGRASIHGSAPLMAGGPVAVVLAVGTALVIFVFAALSKDHRWLDPVRARLERGWPARIFAAVALVALAPLLITVAIVVRLTTKGSILHRVHRRDHDDERKLREAGIGDPGFLIFRLYNDDGTPWDRLTFDHLTNVGSFLYFTGLGELPQLFNVAAGRGLFLLRPKSVRVAEGLPPSHYALGELHVPQGLLLGTVVFLLLFAGWRPATATPPSAARIHCGDSAWEVALEGVERLRNESYADILAAPEFAAAYEATLARQDQVFRERGADHFQEPVPDEVADAREWLNARLFDLYGLEHYGDGIDVATASDGAPRVDTALPYFPEVRRAVRDHHRGALSCEFESKLALSVWQTTYGERYESEYAAFGKTYCDHAEVGAARLEARERYGRATWRRRTRTIGRARRRAPRIRRARSRRAAGVRSGVDPPSDDDPEAVTGGASQWR